MKMILSGIKKLIVIFVAILLCALPVAELQAACWNQYKPIGQVTTSNEPHKFWFHSTDYDAPAIHKVKITCYAGSFAFSETLTTWASRKFAVGQKCDAFAVNYNTCGQKSGVDVWFWSHY